MQSLCKVKVAFNEIEVFDDRIVTRDFFKKREKSVMVKQIATIHPGMPKVGRIDIETSGGQKMRLTMWPKDKQKVLDAIYEAQKN